MKVRKELSELEAIYGDEGSYIVKADANEAYYSLLPEKLIFDGNTFNRYPDSDAKDLRKNLADFYGINAENILINNGSSHVLEMLFSAYCNKGDKVLTFYPGFSMFENYAIKAEAHLIWLKTEDFVQDMDLLIDKAKEVNPKIILICNPNNPTGYVNTREDILKVVSELPETIVVVDEAYSDFSPEVSVLKDILFYKNLLVTKTTSKALGLANLRVGYIAGNEDLIKDLWRVKLPYNVGGASLKIANAVFENIDKLQFYVEKIKTGREYLSRELKSLGFKVYPSGTNFILTEPPVVDLISKLKDKGVLVRGFEINGKNYVRITVMSENENKKIIDVTREVINWELHK